MDATGCAEVCGTAETELTRKSCWSDRTSCDGAWHRKDGAQVSQMVDSTLNRISPFILKSFGKRCIVSDRRYSDDIEILNEASSLIPYPQRRFIGKKDLIFHRVSGHMERSNYNHRDTHSKCLIEMICYIGKYLFCGLNHNETLCRLGFTFVLHHIWSSVIMSKQIVNSGYIHQ